MFKVPPSEEWGVRGRKWEGEERDECVNVGYCVVWSRGLSTSCIHIRRMYHLSMATRYCLKGAKYYLLPLVIQ